MKVFVYGSPRLNLRASEALETEIQRLASENAVIHIVDEFTDFHTIALHCCGAAHATTNNVKRMGGVKHDDIWKELVNECDDVVFVAQSAKCPVLLQTRTYARRVGKIIKILYGNEAKV